MKHLVTTMKGIALDHRGVRGWGDLLVLANMAEENNGDLIGEVCSLLDSAASPSTQSVWDDRLRPTVHIGVRNIAATQRIEEE